MNFSSLYSRLRLTAAATQSEIKSAYYRLSKIYHPDKNNNCPKAIVQFRNITEAYEVLGDPKAKVSYDKEHFPKQHTRSNPTKFRTSFRRSRFTRNKEPYFCEESDSKVQERMKQYRIQFSSKVK